MCKFFSLVSDGTGKIYYLDAKQRQETKDKYESLDSHTSIADYYGFKGELEDSLNKYEYNPLTKKFTVDQINVTDDSDMVEKKCKRLNFKKIVPELIIKPIINPFGKSRVPRVTNKDIELLKQWDSVCSVWDSVTDSVWAYISTFLNIKYKFDFSPAIKLWERGLIASFDGKTWRLHGGINAKVLWEGKV